MKRIISSALIITLLVLNLLPAVAFGVQDGEPILQEGDLLELKVKDHPDLDQQQVIDRSGMIYFSYVEPIKASGLTLEGLKKELAEQYKKNDLYFEFDLRILKLNSKVYLLGNFNKPGEYPINAGSVTLTEAVAMAGGPSTVANLDRLVITRTNGGKTEKLEVNYGRILNGSDKDIMIYPEDRVYVDRKFFAEAQDYLPWISLLLTAAILLKR